VSGIVENISKKLRSPRILSRGTVGGGTTNVNRTSTLNNLQKLQFWKSSGQHAR